MNDAVAFHRNLAGGWEGKYRKPSFASRQQVIEQCLRGMDLKGTAWLDAGCGTGTLARWLAERGCMVHAVDAAPEMLQAACEAMETGRTLPLTFRQVTTIAALPFPGDRFDGILCSSVLEYVPEPDACLAELHRVLRANGRLLISVPSARSLVRTLLRAAHSCTGVMGRAWPSYLSVSKHQYSAAEFESVLRKHSFVPEKTLCFGAPAGGRFPTSEVLSSLLMFSARKQGPHCA
jgi:2-polyprenyl-6-hydroxyphenyl methylase/3-demethylubiquinone-9 3-methyltransferase